MILALTGLAFLIAFAGFALAHRMASDPVWGAVYFLLIFVLEATAVAFEPLHVGIQLQPMDLVTALLMAIGVSRLLLQRPLLASSFLILLLLAISAHGLFSGIKSYGMKEACNEARQVFFTFATLTYAASFSINRLDGLRLLRCAAYAGVALLGLALFRWTAMFLHLSVAEAWSGVVGIKPYRVLTSDVTFYMLEMGVVVTIMRAQLHRHYRLIACGLLLGAICMAHRSVWLAAMVMALLMVVAQYRRVPATWFAGGLLVVSALICALLAHGLTFSSSRAELQSATSTQTLDWRLKGYAALGSQAMEHSAAETLLGQPFGSGYERVIDTRVVKDSPHNYFLQIFLRLGLLGVACFLTLYVLLLTHLRQLLRVPSASESMLLTCAAVSICQLTYACGYGLAGEQGLLLGFGLGVMRGCFSYHGNVALSSVEASHSPPAAVAPRHGWAMATQGSDDR